jgi:hypothetical protein
MTVREINLAELTHLDVHASEAQPVSWRGRQALKLSGLAVVRDLEIGDATIEVDIWAEGSCYPGIAFRVSDVLNYELAYAAPHCSGLWDAVQYDPVFHGSNTWQLYHGDAYQKASSVPTGEWYRLRVDVQESRAAIGVGKHTPLAVPQLAHVPRTGGVGVWTYLPAYFSNLRVSPCRAFPAVDVEAPGRAPDVIGEWFVDGFGGVACEPNGVLNLNRYLPAALGEVRLIRRFEAIAAGEVELDFGFSDELSLALDDAEVFRGSNTFRGFDSYEDRGYAYPDAQSIRLPVEPGIHELAATLKVTEGFGWGLAVALRGAQARLLPAESG